MGMSEDFPVTPEILLRAYAAGIFPMAESADDPGLHWIEPKLGASSRWKSSISPSASRGS